VDGAGSADMHVGGELGCDGSSCCGRVVPERLRDPTMTGLDLALMAVVVASVWFLLRWCSWADAYEDRLERRHEERMRRAREELDAAPREVYAPFDWSQDDEGERP
jgi:hypothetical protein